MTHMSVPMPMQKRAHRNSLTQSIAVALVLNEPSVLPFYDVLRVREFSLDAPVQSPQAGGRAEPNKTPKFVVPNVES